MAKNTEARPAGKIATFVAKYSNESTGANYRTAIEKFLRNAYDLPESTEDDKGKKHRVKYDYEELFNKYAADVSRDRMTDVTIYSQYLVKTSVSKQSARQVLTYAMRVLRAYRVIDKEIEDIFAVEDIKREMKGGAATVDKVMTHDVICKALRTTDVQMKSLILILASSGLRVNELLQMTMDDFDFNMTPLMINVRPEIAKNKMYRFTFISQEARDALNDYLKVRDQFIEGKKSRVENLNKAAGKVATVDEKTDLIFPIEDSTVGKKWEAALTKAGLFSRDRKSQRSQYRIHSLRKFFISQISLAGSKVLAEHLAGHLGYLDASYRQVSPEFAAREYIKLQSMLVICLPETVKENIKIADQKISMLMEKTELQQDSVEGLKVLNKQLQQQLQQQASEQAATMQRQTDMINDLHALVISMKNDMERQGMQFGTPADFKKVEPAEGSKHY